MSSSATANFGYKLDRIPDLVCKYSPPGFTGQSPPLDALLLVSRSLAQFSSHIVSLEEVGEHGVRVHDVGANPDRATRVSRWRRHIFGSVIHSLYMSLPDMLGSRTSIVADWHLFYGRRCWYQAALEFCHGLIVMRSEAVAIAVAILQKRQR